MEDNQPINNEVDNINNASNLTTFLNIIQQDNESIDNEVDNINNASILTTFLNIIQQGNEVELNRALIDTNDILQNSLLDQGGVKNVISDEGELQLREMVYNAIEHKNSTCPIMQNDFNEGEIITVLPCNHVFYPEGINKWLKNIKAECPICRHKLSSKEVCNSPPPHSDIDSNHDEIEDSMVEYDEGTIHLFNERHELERNIEIIGNSINPLIRGMVQNMVYEGYGRAVEFPVENNNSEQTPNDVSNSDMDFQLALYASVIESTMNSITDPAPNID
jgi:hypothetical protein